MLPWYSASTVMHGIFWMVISHSSGAFYCGIQRPRYCMVYFLFYTSIFFCVTRACVWCRDASTSTEHENHQTSNINMKYSGEHNKMQCPDHRQTLAANRQRSQARATPPDINCFITIRSKPCYRTSLPLTNYYGYVRYNAVTNMAPVHSNFCKTALQYIHTVHQKTTDS